MPILLGSGPRGEYGRVNKSELEFHCRSKCEANHACLAFTYKPSEGVCYLKSKMNPVRGTDCKEDCWFFGLTPFLPPSPALFDIPPHFFSPTPPRESPFPPQNCCATLILSFYTSFCTTSSEIQQYSFVLSFAHAQELSRTV